MNDLMVLDNPVFTEVVTDSFQVTVTGLQVSGMPSLEQWTSELDSLWHSENAVNWCKGDMVLYAEQHYGEDWTQAIDENRYKIKTLQNIVTTCKAFPPEERRADISFSNHSECASLQGEQRTYAMNMLASGKWNRANVRAWKKELKGIADKPKTKLIKLQPTDYRKMADGKMVVVFENVPTDAIEWLVRVPVEDAA